MNGYIDAGQYFVTEHENVVEVSKTVWIVSKISGILFWIFIPLTPIGAFLISNVFEKIEHRKTKLNRIYT